MDIFVTYKVGVMLISRIYQDVDSTRPFPFHTTMSKLFTHTGIINVPSSPKCIGTGLIGSDALPYSALLCASTFPATEQSSRLLQSRRLTADWTGSAVVPRRIVYENTFAFTVVLQLALSDVTQRTARTWRAASFWLAMPTRFGIRVMLYFMPVHRGIVIFSQRPFTSWAVEMCTDDFQLIIASNSVVV